MPKNHCTCLLGLLLLPVLVFSQACIPQGDQNSYGTNDVWTGYIYDNPNFTGYMGYVNEGVPGNPNFLQDFGGLYVNYPTNGCPVYTETFSARYKLTKFFAPGNYEFVVSGDDAVRFSIDGGNTWLINNWTYNNYSPAEATVALNGTYNLVLEYNEGAHNNRVYFSVTSSCAAGGSTLAYGTGNIWNGYVFSGIYFDRYKGMVNEGTASSMAFNQNFGGNSVQYATGSCPVFTDFFSVRYRLHRNFPADSYTFSVTGDDKYRLSLDGGNTWVIDRWNYDNTVYTTRNYTANLSGDYDLVLEYYERDGINQLQFAYVNNHLLPLDLLSFSGKKTVSGVLLNWTVGNDPQDLLFEIERSKDGLAFQAVNTVHGVSGVYQYSAKDGVTPPETWYYRLKATDLQGKIYYSKVISVSNEEKGVQIFPTIVVNNVISIRNQEILPAAELMICDMNGYRLIRRQLGNLAANQVTTISLNGKQLSPGVYVAQLFDKKGVVKVEKIMIR